MPKPNPRDFIDNWRTTDASFAAKCRMAVRNNLRKLRTASGCCGNHGQPGC